MMMLSVMTWAIHWVVRHAQEKNKNTGPCLKQHFWKLYCQETDSGTTWRYGSSPKPGILHLIIMFSALSVFGFNISGSDWWNKQLRKVCFMCTSSSHREQSKSVNIQPTVIWRAFIEPSVKNMGWEWTEEWENSMLKSLYLLRERMLGEGLGSGQVVAFYEGHSVLHHTLTVVLWPGLLTPPKLDGLILSEF